MSVRTELFTYISGVTAVTDLLGTDPTRFYFQQLPEGVTYPACRFFVASTPPNAVHNGGGSGVDSPLVQVDMLAESADSLEAVETAVDGALNGFQSGNLSGYRNNRLDSFEESDNLFRATYDYRLHYKTS